MKNRYLKAAQAIQEWIAHQHLRPGTGLPSARLLTDQLGFTPFITQRACQHLIASGLLVRNGYKLFVGTEEAARPAIAGEIVVASYLDSFTRAVGRFLTERHVPYRPVELSSAKHVNPLPVLRAVLAAKPAGVILWMPSWIDSLKSVLEPTPIPVVICTQAVAPDFQRSWVGQDLYRGTEKALRHLVELGHRHIAHVSCGRTSANDRELAACYREVCGRLNVKRSATAIWQAERPDETVLSAVMREQRHRHPEVTALFGDDRAGLCATRIFAVPKELSVVGFYGLEEGLHSRPPLTTVALLEENHTLAAWAGGEILAQIQALTWGRSRPPARQALFVPDLIVRGSTRALTRQEQPRQAPARRGEPARPNPWESWRKPYPYLHRSRAHHWRQLDLTPLANHSLTKAHGWVGDQPLLHFSPGLRSIHGVPFQVIDETRNAGHAVVTFRSPHTHSASGMELPVTAQLPVDERVMALYFLHGCGWAKRVAFAEYLVQFQRGPAARIPLVPLGISPQLARHRLGGPKPNLQDWWPTYEQRDFPHAQRVAIYDPDDPQEYERYLYTLEWINPRPGDEVRSLKVRVDPAAGPTLALIAVTALL